MAIKHLANLDLNHNEIENVKVDVQIADPTTNLNEGRIIYNSAVGVKEMKYYDGTAWVSMKNTDTDVDVSLANLVDRLPEITDDVTIGDATDVTITTSGDLTVTGDLTVNGTTTTVNSNTVTVDDPIFTIGGDSAPASDDNKDRGIEFRWHDGTNAKLGFFGFDDSTGKFTFIPDATNTSEVFSGTKGDLDVNNIELAGTIKKVDGASPTNGQLLIGNTTNSDMQLATLTAGTGISVTNAAGSITIANTGISSGFSVDLDAAGESSVTKSSNTYTVTHSLNSKDLIVQVYDKSTGETVYADIVRSTVNTITVTTATAVQDDDYRVVITKV